MRKRSQRGQALVEFGLSATIMAMIFTGALQFGYSTYAYNALFTRVADGARYASQRDCIAAQNGGLTAYQTAVKNYVIYGNPSGSGTPALTGLAPANVRVEFTYNSAGQASSGPDEVTVSIINYSLPSVFRTYGLNGKPSVTMKYAAFYTIAN